jgi:V/A-type H+-transporting ATPase subunit D
MTRRPHGRAGRSWLHHRLDVARRAAELLELKLRSLLDEQRRLEGEARDLAARWRTQVREADEWLLRTVLAGGGRAVRLAAPAGPGDVVLGWDTVMGVRIPTSARYRPPPAAEAEVDTVAAVVPAREAYRRALATGVRHAAALAAARAVAREVATTRRRLRALDERWLPRLRAELHALELELEELERMEDGTRRRADGRTR